MQLVWHMVFVQRNIYRNTCFFHYRRGLYFLSFQTTLWLVFLAVRLWVYARFDKH